MTWYYLRFTSYTFIFVRVIFILFMASFIVAFTRFYAKHVSLQLFHLHLPRAIC